jgi:hypothetical protein
MKNRIVRHLGTILLTVGLAAVVHADAPGGRFTVTSGSVYDNKTKLTWQQAVSSSTTYSWTDARSHCAALGMGWRLPTVRELLSIVDYRRSGPAVDPIAFSATPSSSFWSASPRVQDPSSAWYVSFQNGSSGWDSASTPYYVRCVH